MRIRSIKPEFFTHEGLFELEKQTSLPIRIGFAGLWCAADKAGRFKWEPRRIGVTVLPYDGVDFSRVLDALFTRGYVVRYRVKGVEYGAIPSFSKHQYINNRERESELPEPSQADDSDAMVTREARVDDALSTPLVGREGEGKDKGMDSGVASSPLFSISGFDGEWKAFKAHRTKIKKPMTERAIELMIGRLEERPLDSIAALQMAMLKGWQSIEWSWFDKNNSENGTAINGSSHPTVAYDAPRGNL